jgi:hypothetical protein
LERINHFSSTYERKNFLKSPHHKRNAENISLSAYERVKFLSELNKDVGADFTLRHDVTPHHYHHAVTRFLNESLMDSSWKGMA